MPTTTEAARAAFSEWLSENVIHFSPHNSAAINDAIADKAAELFAAPAEREAGEGPCEQLRGYLDHHCRNDCLPKESGRWLARAILNLDDRLKALEPARPAPTPASGEAIVVDGTLCQFESNDYGWYIHDGGRDDAQYLSKVSGAWNRFNDGYWPTLEDARAFALAHSPATAAAAAESE